MGAQHLNAQIRLKRGLAEAWARNNPILAKGEPGWATDTKVLKIGDGETHWNDLSYVINVSDYVTEEELRAAIEEYDAQIREWLEELAVDVDAAFEDVYQAIGELAADVDQRFVGINDVINNIGTTVHSHEMQLRQSIQPTLEQHSDTLDRLAGSVSYVNCLKRHGPSLIKMEYTNKAGGWKASITDKNTGEEIHGASLFSRHQIEGWDEHSIEFVNEDTTDATFQIYSVSKEPGVIQVDDVKIEELSGHGLYNDPQCGPSDFGDASGIWTWPATWACTPSNNQAVISVTKPTWSGYVNGNLALVSGGTYYVDINIASYTSGGTNFSIKDSAETKINLLDLNGKKRTGRYLSAAGTTRLYFVAPNDGQITLSFGGSGDQIDDLAIGSCVVYQSNSTQWASTSPMLDNAWVQPEDWYTWGKETDYEGQRAMRFSTSEEKQYWYTKQRTLTLNMRTHYRLSFSAKCVSGGLNIHVKDSNDKTIVRQTISTETAPKWTNFDFSFIPTTTNCTLQIQALGDQNLLYDAYVSKLGLVPIQLDENILCNSNFNNDKYVGGTPYPGRANWTLGNASSIVDGTAQLAVPSDNSLTYVPGCSQDITLIPGNRYRVSFRSKSISHNPMWMPYITFTDEDKIAFVSDMQNMRYETLRLGGPWVKGAAEHYAARVIIQGGSSIKAKYIYFLGAIYSSNEFEVDVKIKGEHGEIVYAQQHMLKSCPVTYSQKYYLELPKDFEFNWTHTIELTFMVNEIRESIFSNEIHGVGIVGNYKFINREPEPDYRIDPNGRIYMDELRADRVVTNIDDGSLDWEV